LGIRNEPRFFTHSKDILALMNEMESEDFGTLEGLKMKMLFRVILTIMLISTAGSATDKNDKEKGKQEERLQNSGTATMTETSRAAATRAAGTTSPSMLCPSSIGARRWKKAIKRGRFC